MAKPKPPPLAPLAVGQVWETRSKASRVLIAFPVFGTPDHFLGRRFDPDGQRDFWGYSPTCARNGTYGVTGSDHPDDLIRLVRAMAPHEITWSTANHSQPSTFGADMKFDPAKVKSLWDEDPQTTPNMPQTPAPAAATIEVGKTYPLRGGGTGTVMRVRARDSTASPFVFAVTIAGTTTGDDGDDWDYFGTGRYHGHEHDLDYRLHMLADAPITQPETAAAPAPAPSTDPAQRLAEALREITGKSSVDPDTVRKIVQEELDKRPAREITITVPSLKIDKETAGHQHPLFADLCSLVANNQRVFISGPAGSGKTTAAEKAAEILKRPFFVQPPVADKFELLGFVDAVGNYQHTPLYEWAVSDGGILLMDEVDGSYPQPLLALNMALANGYAVFPKHGKVPVSEKNTVVCTANTWGGGADFDYVGRAKLDTAFLNRFPSKLAWDYDDDFELEMALARGGTKPRVKVVQKIRENARKHGVKIPVTPRDTFYYCRMRAVGWDHDKCLATGILATCKEDQRAKLLEGVKPA